MNTQALPCGRRWCERWVCDLTAEASRRRNVAAIYGAVRANSQSACTTKTEHEVTEETRINTLTEGRAGRAGLGNNATTVHAPGAVFRPVRISLRFRRIRSVPVRNPLPYVACQI